MRRIFGALLFTAVLCTTGVVGSGALAADDSPGWYLDADLALVSTTGNSESSTLGMGAKLRRQWTRSDLTFSGGATRTESALITRTAQGTDAAFTVLEDKVTTRTAELYFARGWYRYHVSPKFFTYTGVDWLANKFAGIDSRFLVALGAGNTWRNDEKLKLETFYSLTYTFQEDVVENPFNKSDFPGFRFGYDLGAQLSASTRFESNLTGDWNLDNSDDIRFNWYNALPVSISESLQLKPSVQMLWLNEPSLTNIPLVDGAGVPTGDTVAAPLKKLDTIFTLALVVKLGPKAE